MPWKIVKDGNDYWVVKEDTGEKEHRKPHKSREEAEAHRRALYAAENVSGAEKKMRKR